MNMDISLMFNLIGALSFLGGFYYAFKLYQTVRSTATYWLIFGVAMSFGFAWACVGVLPILGVPPTLFEKIRSPLIVGMSGALTTIALLTSASLIRPEE